MLAAIAASLLGPDSVGDNPVEVIGGTAICVLPIGLFGVALLVIGIRRLRRQRKQPIAAQTDSTSEGMDLGDSQDLFRNGLSLFNQGKSREAIPILEKMARIDPTFAPTQFTLGGAYSKVAGDYGDDEDAVRSWANKSADAFRKAISLASIHGGLNDKQVALAEKAVMTYDRTETAYKKQREALLLPEDQRKRIYAEFMETKNSELLQGIDIQDLTAASRRGDLAEMAQSLERKGAESEKVAAAKITEKYRITKEELAAIAREGEEKKWPFEDIKRSNT
jgi:tetratricopeptide (TPR) repeat protein